MKKNILLTFFLVISYLFIIAQEKPQPNDLDKEYTPPQTSIFNSYKTDISSHYSDVSQSKNIVAISIGSLLRGYSELTYERALGKKISITGGYGFYFMSDFLYLASGDIVDVVTDGDWNPSNLRFIINSSDLIPNESHHYTFELKMFFDKTDFSTRNFLAFNTKFIHQQFKWRLDDLSYNTNIMDTETSLDSKIFSLNWGCQWNMGNSKVKFSNELCMGIGVRNNKFYGYTEKDVNSVTNYIKNTEKTSEMKLVINIGYKMGIGW